MLKTYLAVMLGGAVGTGLRMWLSNFVAARWSDSFPMGTLVVNVLGCLVIGAFAALTAHDGAVPISPLGRQVVVIGILGGFTTFSAFGLQTFELLARGDWRSGGMNAALSLVLCITAVWLGHLAVGALHQR
jgi:CrcB protein